MPKTLFVVDDSATMRTAFELTFVGEDVTVITHDGSDGALERAREVRPDGVIVDVNLNGTPGYGLVRSMRQDPGLSGVPVLLLYSDFSPLDEASARACGAAGQVAKPFDTTALIDRVKLLFSTPALGVAPAVSTPTATAGTPFSGERPSQTSPLPKAAPSATGSPARPLASAPRPFASTTVTTAVPPPAPNRPAIAPIAPAPLRPTASAGIPAMSRPAPTLSLDMNETELQLEPAILAELGASAPLPQSTPFAPSPMRGNTAPLGARITPEPPGPRATSPAQARQPEAAPAPIAPVAIAPVAIAPVAPTPVAVAPAAAAPAAPAGPTSSPATVASIAAVADAQSEITKKAAALGLSPAQVEAIAALTREVVERVVWEVVPQLAETMIREEIRRLLSDDSKN